MTIRNTGTVPAQLIARHWIITDAEDKVQEVRGPGSSVISRCCSQARALSITSGCAPPTPVGTMRGSYQMIAEDGTHFDAEIPEFTLAIPRILH